VTHVTPHEALVIQYAESLLMQYGLYGWTVKLDNATKRAGQCQYSTKTISLSRMLIMARSMADSKMTALHEVAHALTQGHHHDKVWQKKFREMGGTGERCYSLDQSSAQKLAVQAKYVGTCPGCGRKSYYNRAVTRKRSCPVCNPHRFDERFEIKIVEQATGKPMTYAAPKRRRARTVQIRLADGRVFTVPSRF